jgi:hypothetical protein
MADEPDPRHAAKVDAMFGTLQWSELWNARRDNVIDGAQFRAELVNLMRWRLENDLGYRTTLPLSSPTPITTPFILLSLRPQTIQGLRTPR